MMRRHIHHPSYNNHLNTKFILSPPAAMIPVYIFFTNSNDSSVRKGLTVMGEEECIFGFLLFIISSSLTSSQLRLSAMKSGTVFNVSSA